MKNFVLLIVVAALIGCAPQETMVKGPSPSLIGPLPREGANLPVVRLYALEDHVRRLMKVDGKEAPDESGSSHWTVPLMVRHLEPVPRVQSERHQKEIDASKKLYREENYIGAVRALQEAVKDEPENPFILNWYARALYRTDAYRPESYVYYDRLISLLDRSMSQSHGEKYVISMDAWFTGAYWKYGTLLMDRGKWKKAAFEISRALALCFSQNDPQPFFLQAYSYLAKAYYHMGLYDVAKYYADAALLISPANEFAKYYLRQIEEKSSEMD